MVKKKKARKPKSFSETIGFNNIFSNEKTDFALGVILVLTSLYVIIAMFSYFYTGQADQSILENLRPGEWMNTDRQFTNYCGSLGAILSYIIITKNFGIAAFFIPVFIILVGLRLMGVYKVNLWKWFFGMALVMIWCSIAFSKLK